MGRRRRGVETGEWLITIVSEWAAVIAPGLVAAFAEVDADADVDPNLSLTFETGHAMAFMALGVSAIALFGVFGGCGGGGVSDRILPSTCMPKSRRYEVWS